MYWIFVSLKLLWNLVKVGSGAGSQSHWRVGSGAESQSHWRVGSTVDPDPNQNGSDPSHWCLLEAFQFSEQNRLFHTDNIFRIYSYISLFQPTERNTPFDRQRCFPLDTVPLNYYRKFTCRYCTVNLLYCTLKKLLNVQQKNTVLVLLYRAAWRLKKCFVSFCWLSEYLWARMWKPFSLSWFNQPPLRALRLFTTVHILWPLGFNHCNWALPVTTV